MPLPYRSNESKRTVIIQYLVLNRAKACAVRLSSSASMHLALYIRIGMANIGDKVATRASATA